LRDIEPWREPPADLLRIELMPLAAREIRELGAGAAARIETKLRIVRAAGWEGAVASGMFRDLGSVEHGIFEIRVTGTGEAYRLLCFATRDRAGRVVLVASCVAKNRLLGRERLKQHVRRAALRRDRWMEANREEER
jgi:putative component of toxin-antitoxin plasmid stabilization module